MENEMRLKGLIAATYTPLHSDGRLNLEPIPALVDFLIAAGNRGLYVCGSTGEGMSLSTEERMQVARAYTVAAAGRVPVIVQVGHNSLEEAEKLAADAADCGAHAISATCPSYFKVHRVEGLVACMKRIASAAPSLPFYYYHIPALTGSAIDMVAFLEAGDLQIPNLAGLKYTDTKLHEFQQCVEWEAGKMDVVWGCDEMLLGALATGAEAAIGSTYNVASKLYLELMVAFQSGDMVRARECQMRSIQMIAQIYRYPFHSAMKRIMTDQGFDCGACRLPQENLTDKQWPELQQRLQDIGFYQWSGLTVGS